MMANVSKTEFEQFIEFLIELLKYAWIPLGFIGAIQFINENIFSLFILSFILFLLHRRYPILFDRFAHWMVKDRSEPQPEKSEDKESSDIEIVKKLKKVAS